MNETINRNPRTLKYWEERLMPSEVEALHEYCHTDPREPITPSEVMETIVNWEGGIATAYHIKSIISRVYDVEL